MNSPNSLLLAEDNANDVELTLAALKEARLADEIVVANDREQAFQRFSVVADLPENSPYSRQRRP